MFELESERLRLREVVENGLPDLLPTYLTNTEVMQASNDSQGETMQYDLERLQMTSRPDEIEVTFGVNLSTRAGAFIASTSAGANFGVTVRWTETHKATTS